MKIEEYLNKVTEQMRCAKACEGVAGELEHHILDQMEAYQREGMDAEEALDRAIMEMGDPVEVGVSMDRIHRPQISWSMLVLMGIISISSVLFQYSISGSTWVNSNTSRQIFFTVAGYICMVIVYFLDYSILGKYATQFGILMLGFMTVMMPFRVGINGSQSFLVIAGVSISIPFAMLLFVPVYGAILFRYRGGGYLEIGKSLIWMAAAVLITWQASLSYALILGTTMLVLFMLAVGKGWFQVNKKRVLGITGGLSIIGLAGSGILTILLIKAGVLYDYQAMRLKAFLTKSGDANYIADMVRSILEKSNMVGSSQEAMELMTNGVFGAMNELVFVCIVACYGILAGVLVAGLLIFLVQKMLRISFGQKNQLGMIIGCGCTLVIGAMVCINILQILGFLPITAILLPFFSSSGSGTMVLYILIGLVLSIYRYQNIPMSLKRKKFKRLRIRFE